MTDHTTGRDPETHLFSNECEFCEENLEAHALGALDATDRARMERHLQWCGPCRRALANVGEITNLLPFSVDPQTPSPMTKTRLFQRIADEATEEPVVTLANPWIASQPPADHPAVTATSRAPLSRSSFAMALVAPLAIALIVLGAWTNSLRNDISDLQAQETGGVTTGIESDLAQSELQLYSMEPSCQDCDDTPASGHLGGNPRDNVGILVAWNLDPSQEHHVWCEDRDGEILLVSNLQVEQSGDVIQTVNFPGAIGGYTTIYVTRNDGTEEMRVALNETDIGDESTPEGSVPTGS